MARGWFGSIRRGLRQLVRLHVARHYGDFVPPSLNIAPSNGFAILSWPVTTLNFQLQENTTLALPNAWSPGAGLTRWIQNL